MLIYAQNAAVPRLLAEYPHSAPTQRTHTGHPHGTGVSAVGPIEESAGQGQ